MLEISTPEGKIQWKMGKHIKGDEAAVSIFKLPRDGKFGEAPGLISAKAHRRRDAFLDLAGTIWPTFKITRDTDTVGSHG